MQHDATGREMLLVFALKMSSDNWPFDLTKIQKFGL